MLKALNELYELAANWSNANEGILSVVIFIVTILFGWASGIFSALRRKPKFKLFILDGPSFCCTYPIGTKHEEFEVHRTGVALYLVVTNVGSAPSSIVSVSIGYHSHLPPFSLQWLKHSVGWFWLTNQSVVLADFQVSIGQKIKVYPFLMQKNQLSQAKTDTFLEVGRSINGVIYFEQADSWGGFYPTVRNGLVQIKVRVHDVFGRAHTSKFWVPSVSFDDARKYNPEFGKTFAEQRGEVLPYDESI